jgi:hypothetical protein
MQDESNLLSRCLKCSNLIHPDNTGESHSTTAICRSQIFIHYSCICNAHIYPLSAVFTDNNNSNEMGYVTVSKIAFKSYLICELFQSQLQMTAKLMSGV